MKKSFSVALVLGMAGLAGVAGAAMPVAVVKDGVAAKDAAARLNDGEASAGLFVRFDELPSAGDPVGFFPLRADKDGYVYVTMPAARGDLIGPLEFKSKKTVKEGEWHHVAFAFSRQQRRFAYWLDGDLQFENNMQWLPKLGMKGETKNAERRVRNGGRSFFSKLFGGDDGVFYGEVKDFNMYDASLTSDYLKPAFHLEKDTTAAKAMLEGALKSKNGNVTARAKDLVALADRLAGAGEKTTERAVFELKRDAANLARICRENGDRQGVGAVQTVDILTQEMILPYVIPEDGEFSGTLNVCCAKKESETGSIVVHAYKPLTKVRLQLSDLTAKDGSVVKASEVDLKLVKRIYCTGGAWMTYHRDPRLRILTPCLLLNDDRLYKVDELKCRHSIRIDYPQSEGGPLYADVTDPDARVQVFGKGVPFNDAKSLLPLDIPEAGRNQQFALTFTAGKDAKPGLYRGTLEVLSDQGAVGTVAVAYRILPFELPQPASYEDLSRRYMSDVNGVRMPQTTRTYAERLAFYKDLAKNCLEHNAEHLGGAWGCASVGKVTKELGYNTDYLFEAGNLTTRALGIGQGDWRDLYKPMETSPDWQQAIADVPPDPQPGRASGTPAYWKLLGSQHKEAAIAVLTKLVNGRVQELREFDPNGTPMAIFWSESAAYVRLADIQRQQAEVAHRLGWKVFAHGGKPNANFASDVQDMNSAAGNMNRETAEKWHAGGGSIFSYCYPFPSSENPAMFRRWNGLERYKTFRYDGSMQHGLVTSMYDEFRDDPGGDGNYRNFAVAYRQQLGLIWTIAWEGWREAYDDVRYATLLQRLCKPHLEDADLGVRGEARRCLIWLNSIDGTYSDMNMFRAGVTHRILNFQKVIANAKK